MPADAAAPSQLRRVRDLPRLEKREEGMSDHAYIETWRAKGPVVVDRWGILCTFSHRHMLQLTDSELTRQVETETVTIRGITSGPIYDFFANTLLFSNGEVHSRRRRPLAKTFAFRLMDALRPRIRMLAEDLVRPHLGADETDFLDDVAGPLPARLIADLIGAPVEDVPRFARLVYSAMRALALRSDEILDEAGGDLADLNDYVADLLASRREAPLDDFLSEYVRSVEGSGLTEDEIRTQIVSVILAGADTTRMGLCSTISQLLQHPDQWAALAADPDGMKAAAAAEGLRFDPVIATLPRVAIRAFEIDDVAVPEGSVLSPFVIGALRDPEVYAEPNRFDIRREDHPRYHPVFGAGVHRCLGEALARAEMEEALAALAALSPHAELAGPPPTLRGLAGVRGIDAMKVRLHGRPA